MTLTRGRIIDSERAAVSAFGAHMSVVSANLQVPLILFEVRSVDLRLSRSSRLGVVEHGQHRLFQDIEPDIATA